MPQTSSSDSSDEDLELRKKLSAQTKKENKSAQAKKRTSNSAAEEGNKNKKAKIATGDMTDGAVQISKLKFARLNEFKGKKYVDIRNFYEKDGKRMPTGKGISLNLDEWEKFKGLISEIDDMVAASD